MQPTTYNAQRTTQLQPIIQKYSLDTAAVMAVVEVESSGVGFNPLTGKMIIRFEPSWFRRLSKQANATLAEAWNTTPFSNQNAQYIKYNNAFSIDPKAAMQSTSIGLMQVMGFHQAELGFDTVQAFWDFGKQSEDNQLELGLRFIKSIPALYAALKDKNWAAFAYHYNGPLYRENNYDTRLLNAYNKHKQA